jgi:integrase
MARSFLRVSEDQLESLRDLRLNIAPMKDAAAQILSDLAPLLEEEKLKAFYRAPQRIIAEAEALPEPTAAAARRVMYALWWRLETRFPLRLDDSLKLKLGENIAWTGPIETAQFQLHMVRTAKGGKGVHVLVPQSVAGPLRLWLTKYRPLLYAGESPYLFPNENGDRRNCSSFGESWAKFMLDRIGFSIHRHSFRHLATYMYLKANPADLAGASTLLGHSTMITTATYYDVLGKLAIWENFDKHLLLLEGE